MLKLSFGNLTRRVEPSPFSVAPSSVLGGMKLSGGRAAGRRHSTSLTRRVLGIPVARGGVLMLLLPWARPIFSRSNLNGLISDLTVTAGIFSVSGVLELMMGYWWPTNSFGALPIALDLGSL